MYFNAWRKPQGLDSQTHSFSVICLFIGIVIVYPWTVLRWRKGNCPQTSASSPLWHKTLTNFKDGHIGAKRSILWPLKYAKTVFPAEASPRTPLETHRNSTRLFNRLGRRNPFSHWTPSPRLRRLDLMEAMPVPNIFVYNRPFICLHDFEFEPG